MARPRGLRRSRVILRGIAAVLFTGGTSLAASADNTAAIQDFMRLSGLGTQADRVTQQMQAQLDARREEVDANALERVQAAMTSAFTPDRIRARMMASLDGAKGEPMQRAIDWLRHPLGSRMTELELAASDPNAESALREYLGQLEHTPPAPERVELIKRLSTATDASDTAMQLIAAMVTSLAKALDVARGGESTAQQEAQAAMVQMEQEREVVEQGILLKLLFTYRAASDEELKQYVTFWESELGHWLHGATVHACIAALTQGADDMATQLVPRTEAK